MRTLVVARRALCRLLLFVVQPCILHVDMDAFFASVEIRDHPELRGKPVLVGGTGARGVVAAASYEARAFGCRSAQPMTVALRRCPQAVVLPPRRSAYVEASRRVFAVFAEFSPVVEALSIDEAFLDGSGEERLLGAPRQIAEAIQARVREATQLTCSVGISAVKFVAKIASSQRKPGGIVEVPVGAEAEFLAPLPISALWGVGPRAEERLREAGITTIGGLRDLGEPTLVQMLGSQGRRLHALSNGHDERGVVADRLTKSMSHEDTFSVDLTSVGQLRAKLLEQSGRVADRLVAAGLTGRIVQIKIRDRDFRTEMRQCTLTRPTADAKVIYRLACELLETVDTAERKFRLTGVGVGGLTSSSGRQLELIPNAEDDGARLQGVVSAIRERFGERALYPADAGGHRDNTTGAITNRPE